MSLVSRFEYGNDATRRDEEGAQVLPSVVSILFLDTLRARYSEAGAARYLDILVILGISPDGSKHPLGVWECSASVRTMQRIAAMLRTRGVSSIDLAVFPPNLDGRACFSQSFPKARIVSSPAHIFRSCLMQADPSERIALARRFRALLLERDSTSALAALEQLSVVEAESAGYAIDALRIALPQLSDVFQLPPTLRKLVCGPSAVEALRDKLCRQCTRIPAEFASRQAVLPGLISLFEAVSAQWRVSVHEWRAITREFLKLGVATSRL